MKFLPNLITLTNALSGCVMLLCLFTKQYALLPYLLAWSLLADFLDGLVARVLSAHSEVGKQLDSLADVISFGVVPATAFFVLLNQAVGQGELDLTAAASYWPLLGFVLAGAAALRLARFNVDSRQSESFIGLNTPAATLLTMGLFFMVQWEEYGASVWVVSLPVLLSIELTVIILLLAEIPMFSFKIRKVAFQGNEVRLFFIIGTVLCFIFLKTGTAMVVVIVAYILISLLLWLGGYLKIAKE